MQCAKQAWSKILKNITMDGHEVAVYTAGPPSVAHREVNHVLLVTASCTVPSCTTHCVYVSCQFGYVSFVVEPRLFRGTQKYILYARC